VTASTSGSHSVGTTAKMIVAPTVRRMAPAGRPHRRTVRNLDSNPYLFQWVKDRVDIADVAVHYGLSVDRKGWCTCPFHGEKTPSFHFHNQRGKCFGCGWSGDVIDLVAALLNTGPLEAAKDINQAFRLGLDLGTPVDRRTALEAVKVRQERERFKTWREGAVRALTDRHRALHMALVYGDSADPVRGVSDSYAAAARDIDMVAYYLDLVAFGDEGEIKSSAAAIDDVVERIKEAGSDEGG
jgi:hypothetical protein